MLAAACIIGTACSSSPSSGDDLRRQLTSGEGAFSDAQASCIARGLEQRKLVDRYADPSADERAAIADVVQQCVRDHP